MSRTTTTVIGSHHPLRHIDNTNAIPGYIIRYASHNTLPLPVSVSISAPNSRSNSQSYMPSPSPTTTNAFTSPLNNHLTTLLTTFPIPHLITIITAIKRHLKLLLASTLTLTGVIAAWWALDLAMWTAVKDYRDDCRNSKLAGYGVSASCEEVLGRELGEPSVWRGWRSYTVGGDGVKGGEGKRNARRGLKGLPATAADGSDREYARIPWIHGEGEMSRYYCFGPTTHFKGDDDMSSHYDADECESSGPSAAQRIKIHAPLIIEELDSSPSWSSESLRGNCIQHCYAHNWSEDCELWRAADSYEIAREGISKQGDAVIMYGGMERYWVFSGGIEAQAYLLKRHGARFPTGGGSGGNDAGIGEGGRYGGERVGLGVLGHQSWWYSSRSNGFVVAPAVSTSAGDFEWRQGTEKDNTLSMIVSLAMLFSLSYRYFMGKALVEGNEGSITRRGRLEKSTVGLRQLKEKKI